ncbi:hypothetical protein KP509_01G087000 [Ceratopteris richardii]|uniref:Uncharacterized protein n=1 Tax=Ceratopteris richardii TaxID=49495 RepID=A0A8T2VID6_CERRI|nr:hypothetical protein KP509_01G087000 [Ceratopteris richardii]
MAEKIKRKLGYQQSPHHSVAVICERGTSHADRLIVDIDFRSQFEIARPTKSYIDLTACLPLIFVGSAEKVSQVLRILAEEAKLSLKNNKMYVSPWRSLSYMRCKWLYPLARSHNQTRVTNQGLVGNVVGEHILNARGAECCRWMF